MTAERTCEVVAMSTRQTSAAEWARILEELHELMETDREPSPPALESCQGGSAVELQ